MALMREFVFPETVEKVMKKSWEKTAKGDLSCIIMIKAFEIISKLYNVYIFLPMLIAQGEKKGFIRIGCFSVKCSQNKNENLSE